VPSSAGSSPRESTPSFGYALYRWCPTVRGLRISRAAMSRFDIPRAAGRTIRAFCDASTASAAWAGLFVRLTTPSPAGLPFSPLAARGQLLPRPLGPRRGPELLERLQRRAERQPRLGPPPSSAQPGQRLLGRRPRLDHPAEVRLDPGHRAERRAVPGHPAALAALGEHLGEYLGEQLGRRLVLRQDRCERAEHDQRTGRVEL
jgi:hypothetical protein